MALSKKSQSPVPRAGHKEVTTVLLVAFGISNGHETKVSSPNCEDHRGPQDVLHHPSLLRALQLCCFQNFLLSAL